MSSDPLRPGSTLGPYPERESTPPSRLDDFTRRLTGPLVRRRSAAQLDAKGFLALVNAEGPRLSKLESVQLSNYASELREKLLRDGLIEKHCSQAFAVIREMSDRILGMRHFDSQIMGGWAMLQGMLAEMETGEGKTLTATLPACTAAMAGIPVHVITVNDYLATRDSELMSPLYNMLGITVGAISDEIQDPRQRKIIYECDIAYCTNQQVAFDYLRDRVTMGHRRGNLFRSIDGIAEGDKAGGLILRGLCFGIVDEADSVLIDEARTPLKLSGPSGKQIQARILHQALRLADKLENYGNGFRVSDRKVTLTANGKAYLSQLVESMDNHWASARRRELLVTQALTAKHLFIKDQHYLVRDGQIQIIDQNTGRVMPDRSWELGLHQMIEKKEGLEVSDPSESIARITYQRFFRRYLRLGAMSGTAQEVSGELWSVYRMPVVKIPTHKPSRRTTLRSRMHRTAGEKWQDVVAQTEIIHLQNRPVLIGTRTVAASENLSLLLSEAGLTHQVLNARHDRSEAIIIAQAGMPGRITVATNMAGRGTDISLAPGVAEAGGLHVIATELNEARRIDRQLFGRCARQGDPGSVDAILSWEDELLTNCAPRLIKAVAQRINSGQLNFTYWTGRLLTRIAQRRMERRNAATRRILLKQDQQLDDIFAFSGPME
jgi:preprotein translocase subunit SecA